MTLKKDLIKLLNKYSDDSTATRVLMDAIGALGGEIKPESKAQPSRLTEPKPEGITITETGIIITPTPTEDYPKGLVIECNGKKAEGDIKAGQEIYELPPIIAEGETARAYIKPRHRSPILVGAAETAHAKDIVASVPQKERTAPISFPGV